MIRLACAIVGIFGVAAFAQEMQHLGAVPFPDGFAGQFAYDTVAHRLWLISYGPPASRQGPSKLMELDPSSGRILAAAELPLLGGFGSPAAIGEYLFQPVAYESKVYKISLAAGTRFGKIEAVLPIPQVADLVAGKLEEPLKFAWLEVNSVAAAADGNLLLYAAELGELVTLDRETGAVLKRVRTLKGLGGIATAKAGGKFLVLANIDPDDAAARDKARRFDLRAPEVVPWKRSKVTLFAHRPDQKTVMWILLDGESGEPLGSIEDNPSPAFGSGAVVVAVSAGNAGANAAGNERYEQLRFLAMGPAGILTMAWNRPIGAKKME